MNHKEQAEYIRKNWESISEDDQEMLLTLGFKINNSKEKEKDCSARTELEISSSI